MCQCARWVLSQGYYIQLGVSVCARVHACAFVPVCVPLSFSVYVCMYLCAHAHAHAYACLCMYAGWGPSWGRVGIELQASQVHVLLLNYVLPVVIFFFKCKTSRTKTNDKNMSSSGLQNNVFKGSWRDGSVAESNECLVPGFNFQHSRGSSCASLTVVLEDVKSSFDLCWHQTHMEDHVCIQAIYIYTHT